MKNKITDLLQKAFERRKKSNPLFSQRALAKKVKLSSSYLSKIFRGERPLPLKLLGNFARHLKLDHHETAELQRLLLQQVETQELSSATGIHTMNMPASAFPSEYANMGESDLWLLQRWFYLPILNMVTTDDFDPNTLASRLGITQEQAMTTLKELVARQYLRVESDGSLHRTELKFRFPTHKSVKEVRDYHKAMISRSLPLLEKATGDKDFSERLISGITLAGDPQLLQDAKVVIEEALYRAAEILASGKCTEIFQINLQLFKLTR